MMGFVWVRQTFEKVSMWLWKFGPMTFNELDFSRMARLDKYNNKSPVYENQQHQGKITKNCF